MSYAEQADVVLEFKGLELSDEDGELSEETVDEWCAQASSTIDSYVGVKYVVPVTSGDGALSTLKGICITLVKARVKDFLKIKTGKEETSQAEGPDPVKQAYKDLEDFRDGKRILAGATLVSSTQGTGSYLSSEPPTDLPQFRRGQDDW